MIHPDAKIIAMIEDLDSFSCYDLLCAYVGLREYVKQAYIDGSIPAHGIIATWNDQRADS